MNLYTLTKSKTTLAVKHIIVVGVRENIIQIVLSNGHSVNIDHPNEEEANNEYEKLVKLMLEENPK